MWLGMGTACIGNLIGSSARCVTPHTIFASLLHLNLQKTVLVMTLNTRIIKEKLEDRSVNENYATLLNLACKLHE